MSSEVKCLVNFELMDVLQTEYSPDSFDLMYSRDAIMHIAQKEELYKQVFVSMFPPNLNTNPHARLNLSFRNG